MRTLLIQTALSCLLLFSSIGYSYSTCGASRGFLDKIQEMLNVCEPPIDWIKSSKATDQLIKEVCAAIDIAKDSEVNERDFFHCHSWLTKKFEVPADQMEFEWTEKNISWPDIHERYVGLACHAHEYDRKRKFGNENNWAILVLNGKAEFSDLVPNGQGGPSIMFYESANPMCNLLKARVDSKCKENGPKYCFGLATGRLLDESNRRNRDFFGK